MKTMRPQRTAAELVRLIDVKCDDCLRDPTRCVACEEEYQAVVDAIDYILDPVGLWARYRALVRRLRKSLMAAVDLRAIDETVYDDSVRMVALGRNEQEG